MPFRERNYPLRIPGLYLSPDGSETGGVLPSQVPKLYQMIRQRKCDSQIPTPNYKYSFRLNEEQKIHFRQMPTAAGSGARPQSIHHQMTLCQAPRSHPPQSGIHNPRQGTVQFPGAHHRILAVLYQSFSESQARYRSSGSKRSLSDRPDSVFRENKLTLFVRPSAQSILELLHNKA